MRKAQVINGVITKERATRIDAVDANGTQMSLPSHPTEAQYEEGHLFTIDETPKPDGDKVTRLPMALVNGVPTTQWLVEPYTEGELAAAIDALRSKHIESIATLRKVKAEKGFDSPMGRIKTDRGTRQDLVAATFIGRGDTSKTRRWKLNGAFVTLATPTLNAIIDMVDAHVQSCFDNEEVLFDQINAATTLAELDAIDITVGWPV
jgi:hypothetical protein